MEAFQANLWLFSAFGKFVEHRERSRWKMSVRFASLKFPLSWGGWKAMVRAAVEHALGEMSGRWELLTRIYGQNNMFLRPRHEFNFAYFHAKQTQRPRGPAGYRLICICDCEDSPVVPAGVISLKCSSTSSLFESLAVLARQRINCLVSGPGSFSEAWSGCRVSCSWRTTSLASDVWHKRDSWTSQGRAIALLPMNEG